MLHQTSVTEIWGLSKMMDMQWISEIDCAIDGSGLDCEVMSVDWC